MGKSIDNKPNILFKNINEFDIQLVLVLIFGIMFILLSGYTSYALFSDTIISDNVISLKVGRSKTFLYTGNYEEYNVPYTGYYKIEAWGAQGGGTGEYEGGKGAYTSGIIRLLKGETLYVYVGETGNTTDTKHTIFNNGSSSLSYSYNNYSGYLYAGGGATDIRLVSGTWNNDTSLNSRIMVAAGGGGGSSYFSINKGGAGGGLVGLDGVLGGSNGVIATGATQITSGTDGNSTITNTFGVNTNIITSEILVTKGGTGYYTGGNGAHAGGTVGTGAGGSSFISGYAGVNAITSSTNRMHTNNTIHYSNKYFISGKMEAGVSSGNGKAKITYVSSTKPERINVSLDNVRYIKDCANGSDYDDVNRWNEIQAIYNGINILKGKTFNAIGSATLTSSDFVTDGDIGKGGMTDSYSTSSCIVIDLGQTYDLDEIAVWYDWEELAKNVNINYTYVSSDNINWVKVIESENIATTEGKRVNAYDAPSVKHSFSYTGACEKYTIPYSGYYKLEAWGAQGGGTGEYEGGKGGYTSGIIRLLRGEILYVCVGESGNTTETSRIIFNNGSSVVLCTLNGSSKYLYAGGGATDIRLVGGTWNNETSLNSRIMVAAGGGGGSSYFSINKGGAGGGLVGLNGTMGGSNGVIATGASQVLSGTNGNSTITNTFGVNTNTSVTGYGFAKGGTGYYTGGNGAHADGTVGSGAGGSSFISGYAGVNAIASSTDRTHTNNTLHYSNKYFIQGETKKGIRSGNGLAIITLLGDEPVRVNKMLDGVRYIKDCTTGDNSGYKSWEEIQAIRNGVNVALGKPVTGTGEIHTSTSTLGTWSYNAITDGNIANFNNDDAHTRSEGNQCVIVDLGQTYDLDEIAVWHYWKEGKTYYNNYTYVSSDNANWIKVIDREEAETSEGKRVNAYE